MSTMLGIDISHWNGAIETIVKKDKSIKFAIIKATEGRTYKDSMFERNIHAAVQLGLCVGAYHYARPENNSPAAEAAHFVETIRKVIEPRNLWGKVLLALDWEGDAVKVDPKGQWAREWCFEVYTMTGIKPVVYCSYSTVTSGKMKSFEGADNGLWVAKWGSSPANGSISPWKFSAIWQYTNKPYDKDKFFGNEEQWLKYCASDMDIVDEGDDHCCGCGCPFCDGGSVV